MISVSIVKLQLQGH